MEYNLDNHWSTQHLVNRWIVQKELEQSSQAAMQEVERDIISSQLTARYTAFLAL
jgi:hypothetical protein